MDFLKVNHIETSKGRIEVVPEFLVIKSKDLMVRGGSFYAVWDDEEQLWSDSEFELRRLVDNELRRYADKLQGEVRNKVVVKYLINFSNGMWSRFINYVKRLSDTWSPLDASVTFANTTVEKGDYVSRRLSYPLEEGPTPAFDELMNTLYDGDNLRKLMWAIGSIGTGDSKHIQKFIALFGKPGTGKSTVLNLVQKMFDGYCSDFEARSLVGGNNFALEVFRHNPLVGLDHEGDLSRIRNNSVLNSVVSHDSVVMNVKHISAYSVKLTTFLMVATNKPVTITDSNSGITRRLIDVRPTGKTVPPDRYMSLIRQMDFELGHIAYKCMELFKTMGRDYYASYRPLDMMLRTDVFYNFVVSYRLDFETDEYTTLKRAWELYKEFCDSGGIEYRLPKYKFRDSLRDYFEEFHDIARVGSDNKQVRSVYLNFKTDMFLSVVGVREEVEELPDWLQLRPIPSLIDREWADRPAQLVTDAGGLPRKWDDCVTTLSDIDTSKPHHVLPPQNVVVVDFDIMVDGEKNLEASLKAASKFPETHVETSRSGNGVHLHYYYTGDVEKLSRVYDDRIDVIPPVGNTSIRRVSMLCNDVPIATLGSGLPEKEKVKPNMLVGQKLASEGGMRRLIRRALAREIHHSTRPSVDFIAKVVQDAQDQGLTYSIEDLKPLIVQFAAGSTNQASYCISVAMGLKYASSDYNNEAYLEPDDYNGEIVFFDAEILPNLILIKWKRRGVGKKMNTMINPSPEDITKFSRMKLVGFNNRRYDNHVLYARILGLSIMDVYYVSKGIIGKEKDAFYMSAYNISYADVYDFSTKKQTLKEWQIQLGLPHKEMEVDWDEPLPESEWDRLGDYCENDVTSLEAVFEYCSGDFKARKILAAVSGLTVNHSTRSHMTKIVFNNDRKAIQKLPMPDLSKEFPGYEFKDGKSSFMGEDPSEGGYVYAVHGFHRNVGYYDVRSMHPTSIVNLNLFGEHTVHYANLKDIRVFIAEGNVKPVEKLFDGRLATFIKDPEDWDSISKAMKLGLNSAYGDTFASFPNAFRHPDNHDNVVAKRGALFMIALRQYLLSMGVEAIHFKTDSIKIADYSDIPNIQQLVFDFGKKYGYDFGVEGIYEKMVLTTDADLVGKWTPDTPKYGGQWTAVGARFGHPYVFKKLFSREPITIKDYVEVRRVKKGKIYIKKPDSITGENLMFIGSVGAFLPVTSATVGGVAVVKRGESYSSVSDTKGYLWAPSDVVIERHGMDIIDMRYYDNKVDTVVKIISKYVDIETFLDQE